MAQNPVTADNVWIEHFEKNGDMAKCKKCGTKLQYTVAHYYFVKHLRRKHQEYLKNKLGKEIITPADCNSQVGTYGKQCENVFKMKCIICKPEANPITLRVCEKLRDHVKKCEHDNAPGPSHKPDTNIKITVKNIRRFFNQLRKTFEAECKHCKFRFKYVRYEALSNHLNDQHQEYIKDIAEENRKRALDDEKSYLNQTTSFCLVCKMQVTTSNFLNHINEHTVEDLCRYEVLKRALEYFKACEDDELEVICTICPLYTTCTVTINNTRLNTHVENCPVKNMQEIIITKDNLKNHYTIQQNTLRAKCNSCEKEVYYADISEIYCHIQDAHGKPNENDLKNRAKHNLEAEPMSYFDASNLQCKICKAVFENQEYFPTHIRGHGVKQVTHYEIINTLLLSYSIFDDFDAKCNECDNVYPAFFPLPIANNIENHLYSCNVEDSTVMM